MRKDKDCVLMRAKYKEKILLSAIIFMSIILLFACKYDYHIEEVSGDIYTASPQKTEQITAITTQLNLGGKEEAFNGFFSEKDQRWCFVFPAGYEDVECSILIKTDCGNCTVIKRTNENVLPVKWGELEFEVSILSADNIESLYVILNDEKTISDVHGNKEEKFPGNIYSIDSLGRSAYFAIYSFDGHGNDSWKAEKKSYDIKLTAALDLFGMGANNDYVLIAGYRDNSLMNFCTTTELVQELGFKYAPEFRLVNLYVAGDYMGVYFLAERMEIDQNRIDINNVYKNTKVVNGNVRLESFENEKWESENGVAKRCYYCIEKNPDDITGGYLLEMDSNNHDDSSARFVSDRNIRMTLKRARCASKEQVDYIANYWQEFENALYSETGTNDKGKYYSEYIDVRSFAMQWLIYELVEEDSMHSSIYYYKESDVMGDGLIHACYPWDMEHSYLMTEQLGILWNVEEKQDYWSVFYMHEDFQKEVAMLWKELFMPAIDLMVADECVDTGNGFRNLSWYEEKCNDIYQLESRRWEQTDPLERCARNREFLKIRQEVLSKYFGDTVDASF